MTTFASGRKALAVCDICGFPYKLRKLKNIFRNGVDTNIKACPECWNPQHPQDNLGKYRIEDIQAIRNPRPDFAELPTARGMIFQIPESEAFSHLDPVGVTIV